MSSDPEIGIAFSHMGIWKDIVKKKTPYTLILEDDFVFMKGESHFLESLDISPAVVDASSNYLTYLDRKIQDDTTGVSSSYNAGTNQTTFTIPYSKTNTMKCVGRVGGSNTAGQAITIASQSGTSIVIAGDMTSSNLWFGEQYEFAFVFSQQFTIEYIKFFA